MESRETGKRRRRRIAAALIFGSPVFAVAIVLGVALTDIFLLPSVNLPDFGVDWIVPVNAGLAFVGSAAGCLFPHARIGARIAIAFVAGALAVGAYFGMILLADKPIPGF